MLKPHTIKHITSYPTVWYQYFVKSAHTNLALIRDRSIPTPCWAGSRSVSVATDSGHNSSSQTHSQLPQCDSRPVISAEPAHHNRVESPPRGCESDIQTVGNSSSGHVCHSPQHTSSPVYVLSSGTSSSGNRCPVTGLLNKVFQKLRTILVIIILLVI